MSKIVSAKSIENLYLALFIFAIQNEASAKTAKLKSQWKLQVLQKFLLILTEIW